MVVCLLFELKQFSTIKTTTTTTKRLNHFDGEKEKKRKLTPKFNWKIFWCVLAAKQKR